MAKDEKEKRKRKKQPSKGTPGKHAASNATPKAKKQKVETISRTKQLEARMQKSRPRQKSLPLQPSIGKKTCVNGKPMPSLAELERMFETSSDESEMDSPAPKRKTPSSPNRCTTPNAPIAIDVGNLSSPTTIQQLSNKVIDFISQLPDTIVLDEDPPSPPPKTRKKPDVAYIERTKDCKQLSDYKSHAVVGAGDNKKRKFKDTSDTNDEFLGRKKKTKIKDPSTSVFNRQTDEIVNRLKAVEASDTLSSSSSDSNKTIPYDCGGAHSHSIRYFSPLPSTSTDTETFLKNVDRFNESMMANEPCNNSCALSDCDIPTDDIETKEVTKGEFEQLHNDDVEIIDVPCETVIIDDDGSNSYSEPTASSIVKVKSEKTIVIDDGDDIGDLYSSIINVEDYEYNNSDVCEVIDVDNIIAENKAVINKYKKAAPKVVTYVDLNDTSILSNCSNLNETSDFSSTSNCTNSINMEPPSTPYNSVELEARNKGKVIEDIVKSFFQRQSMSEPVAKSCFNAVFDTLVQCTESIVRAFTLRTPVTTPVNNALASSSCNPLIIDLDLQTNSSASSTLDPPQLVSTINLTLPNAPPVTPTSLPSPSNANVPSVSAAFPSSIPPNFNSVILANNNLVPDNNNSSSIYQTPKAKRQYKKKKQVPSVLPTTPVNSERENQPPSRLGECPICMEGLSNQAIASTICGHLFCMPCIQAATRASGKKCPTCRKALRGIGFHQIFI